ncbi:retrovirus-related pol polyprotein from transposon TNT 1-94 [Tanacetum coccineum]|uniref:Retrovirus-related pol polyprotein from transposon TNT 1-94 n=1 Tax=Tanacetum coccineum TaxID=301880 RepID=A0ABQ5BN05_9ASTR
MRLNHQNFSNSRRTFAPTAVLTKSGIVPISAARQSSSRAATLVSDARPINTVAPKPFVISVNTAKGNKVTRVVGKQWINAVKSLVCWVWRPKIKGDPQDDLKDTGIFDSNSKGGKISGKGKIRTRKLDFEDVYFVKELKFNLFSVSQMCDRKNSVLFTETKCLILSPDFKLHDESQVLLKVPRKNNMYSFDLKNVVPSKGLTCLFAKATNDESKLWHRRLGHINFKTMNKLVKGNLVRGLPSKIFENDHTCVACQKGKQYKATCKCDNGTEFKNYDMNQFRGIKRIKMEFKNARTLQQNGVAERKNMTLIEAAKSMLADSLLPIPFWAKAVNTSCYVQNRVLVTKPHNKTPCELLIGRTPIISFMRPFGCPITILNTLDHLGKFDGKADEGFLVGYSINSKAFRVFNSRTRKTNSDVGKAKKEKVPDQEYILLPLLHTSSYVPSSSEEAEFSPKDDAGKKATEQPACDKGGKTDDLGSLDQQVKSGDDPENINNTNSINTASPTFNAVGDKDGNFNSTNDEWVFSTPIIVNAASSSFGHPDALKDHSKLTNLEDTSIFDDAYDDGDEGAEADYNNLETIISVSPIPSTRANKDHPKDQIIREVEAMQEELLQFKLLNVWTLVDLPYGKKVIGYRQEEGIDYDEVFAPVARIKAIRLFFAYASFMDFIVYQMDVKSAFLYGTIEEEVYISQPLAPRAWYETLSTYLLENGFRKGTIDKTLFIKKIKNDILLVQVEQRKDGIFLSQDKYVCDILKKFGFSSVKTASTPMETHKPLSKDADGTNFDVHLYRSMIRSLMYLTSSRADIMFAVCACLRFQVQPKASHMHAVKRIFRYLKGQPTLGLWYLKDSPMELIAYSDSDYAGVSLDRKSITGGCQFLGCRIISWQCKKQTIMANFTTETEYIAASNCCAYVLWLQNQLLDYGYNFM